MTIPTTGHLDPDCGNSVISPVSLSPFSLILDLWLLLCNFILCDLKCYSHTLIFSNLEQTVWVLSFVEFPVYFKVAYVFRNTPTEPTLHIDALKSLVH